MNNGHGQRWVEVELQKLSECQNDQQAWDATNPRFDYRAIVGQIITITSARSRRSDYGDRTYAVIGFISDSLGDGQFKIGGHAAELPLKLADSGSLPADLILRHKPTKAGRDFYKWDFPSC